MHEIVIPRNVFLKRIEKAIKLGFDNRNVLTMLKYLVEFLSNVDEVKITNTIDSTSVIVYRTIVEYNDIEDRKVINKCLAYPVTEEEIENVK